jgi:hypothetical protein
MDATRYPNDAHLHRLQKTLVGATPDAAIGQQIEVLASRLDEGQLIPSPHFMQGILIVVWKRVQVGVGRGIGGVASSYFQRKEETQRYTQKVRSIIGVAA